MTIWPIGVRRRALDQRVGQRDKWTDKPTDHVILLSEIKSSVKLFCVCRLKHAKHAK